MGTAWVNQLIWGKSGVTAPPETARAAFKHHNKHTFQHFKFHKHNQLKTVYFPNSVNFAFSKYGDSQGCHDTITEDTILPKLGWHSSECTPPPKQPPLSASNWYQPLKYTSFFLNQEINILGSIPLSRSAQKVGSILGREPSSIQLLWKSV